MSRCLADELTVDLVQRQGDHHNAIVVV